MLLADVVDDGVQCVYVGRARGAWFCEELVALAHTRHAHRRCITRQSAHRQRWPGGRGDESGLHWPVVMTSGGEAQQPNSSGEFATHTDSDREEIEVKGDGQYGPGRQGEYRRRG